MDNRFQPLEHTADKGIWACGDNLESLFENAAYGMFSLMADLEKYAPAQRLKIEVEASDLESLLQEWLAELMYRFEVDRLLFVKFDVNLVENTRMEGIASAIPFSDEIEWIGPPIKAVTHHDLYVRKVDEHWEAQVIFDV